MIIESDQIQKARIGIIYLIMAAGALLGIDVVQLFGFLLFCFFVLRSDLNDGMAQIMALVPNIAVMSSSVTGLLGVAFAIILLKIILRQGMKVSVRVMCLMSLLYLFCISALRISGGNIYDFALVCQVVIVVITWTSLLQEMTSDDAILYIDYFRFGCLLMAFGMLISYPFAANSIGRFRAISDDCNYTGAVMCVLLGISLLVFCYKLPLRHNTFYMIVAVIMGLATGSRGFMLSTAIILIILLFTKSFGQKTAKIVVLSLFLMAVVYVLYLVHFGPVMTIYDNTIGRTMDLQDNYNEGDFMDVTSGRAVLWAYYMLEAVNDPKIMVWGRGFYDYFLEENGGFGLAAHNMYISSIIGIGIVGTLLVLIMYFSILRTEFVRNDRKINIAFSSIIIALLVNYFFLDGMLELRLITYHAMVVMMMIIYKANIKSIDVYQ